MTDLTEASPGPSTETHVSAEVVQALTPDAPTDTALDDELAAAWDRASKQEDEPEHAATDKQDDTAETEVETVEEPAPQIELPTDLPVGLKDHWSALPEDARKAIETSHREMANKVSQFSREVSAFKPIRGAIEASIKANPYIANMRPDEIAGQIPQLVAIGQSLSKDPVNTILTIAKNRGVLDKLTSAITGQASQPGGGNEAALQHKISQLEGRLAELSDPNRLRNTFDTFYRESTVEQEVTKFASETEGWAEVEGHLPATIPLAQEKLGQNASPRSVLEEATRLAIQIFMPEKASKPAPAPEASQEPDPAKVQKAKDAKSVNVKATSHTKGRALSLDEELSAIYDRAAS